MKIRCDKPMRRSKERTIGVDEIGIKKWRCTGDCWNCVCGLITKGDGTSHHVNLLRGGKDAKIHDTTEADH